MTITGAQLRIAHKNPCRLATTGNKTLSGLTGVDGWSPVAGDRILVWMQTAPEDNGIYIAASTAWTRADDFDESNDDRITAGLEVYVQQGALYGTHTFRLTTLGSITLGSTALTFIDVGVLTGPASSIDNAIPRFDGTSGKILQGGATSNNILIDDNGNIYPEALGGGDCGTAARPWTQIYTMGPIHWSTSSLDTNIGETTLILTGANFQVPDGTAALPSLAFAGNPDTGLYYGGGLIVFSYNSVNTLTINGTTLAPAAGITGYTFGGTGVGTVAVGDGGVINFNGGDITLTHSTGVLTVAGGNLVIPTRSFLGDSDGQAVNDIYMDGRVVWNRRLLVPEQLGHNVGSLTVQQAMLYWFTDPPSSGDTITFTDGTTTRTYGYGTGGDVTVTISSTAQTMQNLATAISGDGSGLWDAVYVDGDALYGSAFGAVVIYRTLQDGVFNDRLYGSFTGNSYYVNFFGEWDYRKANESGAGETPPTSDPTTKSCGVGLRLSDFVGGDLFSILVFGGGTLYLADKGVTGTQQWRRLDFDTASADVVGPVSAIDNALARFDLTTGKIIQGGATSNNVILDDTGNLYPEVSDGGALGTSTLMWSDVFIASGGVVNFNNGDVTITHSAKALAFAGATSGYSFDDNVTITNAASPALTIQETAGSAFQIYDADVTNTVINKTTASGSGGSSIYINTLPGDGTSTANLILFRSTSTTGLRRFTIHLGDGTGTKQHELSTGDSYLNAESGNVGIGASTTPKEQLEVFGGVAADYLLIDEQASQPTVAATEGAFWVKSDAPNTPKFTDDAGTDWSLLALSGGGSGTTNAVAKFTGTAGGLASSGVLIDGSNNIQFPAATARLAWGTAGYAYIESDGGLTADMIISSTDQIHFKPGVWTGSGVTIKFDANGQLIDTQSIIPIDSTKDLGSSTKRWANVYMASTIDYNSNLVFSNATTDRMTLTTGGDLQMETAGSKVGWGAATYVQGNNTTNMVISAADQIRFSPAETLSLVMDGPSIAIASQAASTVSAAQASFTRFWGREDGAVFGTTPMMQSDIGELRSLVTLGGGNVRGDLTTFVGTGASNLVQWSENLSDSLWTKFVAPGAGSLTANDIADPRGESNNADLLNWTTAGIGLRQTITDGIASSSSYVVGFWARNKDHSNPTLTVYAKEGTGVDVTIGSNWQRYEVPVTSGTGTAYLDIAANTGTGGIWIWGLQLEAKGTLGSYRLTQETAQGTDFEGFLINDTGLVTNRLHFRDASTWIGRNDNDSLAVDPTAFVFNSDKKVQVKSSSSIAMRPYSAAKDQVLFTDTGISIASEASSTTTNNLWLTTINSLQDLRYTNSLSEEYSLLRQSGSNHGDMTPFGGFGEGVENLFSYSEELNQTSYWTSPATATITSNATTAPDGTTTADRVQWASGSGIGLRQIVPNTPFTTSQQYAVSFWAKAVSGSYSITVDIRDGASVGATIGSTGWRRYVAVCTAGSAGTHFVDFTGLNGHDIYFWGLQVQSTANVGPYIRTVINPAVTARPGHVLATATVPSEHKLYFGEDAYIRRMEPGGAFANYTEFTTDDGNLVLSNTGSGNIGIDTGSGDFLVTTASGDISFANTTGGQTLHIDATGRIWITNGYALRFGDSAAVGLIGDNTTPYLAVGADSGSATGNLYNIGGANIWFTNTVGTVNPAGKRVAKFDVVNEHTVFGFGASGADRSAASGAIIDAMGNIRLSFLSSTSPTSPRVEFTSATTYVGGDLYTTETGTTKRLLVFCDDGSQGGFVAYYSGESQHWYVNSVETMLLDAANGFFEIKNGYHVRLGNNEPVQWGGTACYIVGDDASTLRLHNDADILIENSASVGWVNFDQARLMGVYGTSTTIPASPATVFQAISDTTSVTASIENESTGVGAGCQRNIFSGISTIGTGKYWLECHNSGGLIGGIRGNGDDTTVIYAAFAGQHDGQLPGSSITDDVFNDGTQDWTRGMILVSTGNLVGDGAGAYTEMPQTALATTASDTKVVGIYVGADDDASKYGSYNSNLPVAHYSALGHGTVLVTDKNGDVDAGDLVTSSTIPGHGQKQADDIIHSYTVCKVTQQIVWADVTDTIDEGAETYKYALLACFVYCG